MGVTACRGYGSLGLLRVWIGHVCVRVCGSCGVQRLRRMGVTKYERDRIINQNVYKIVL